MSIKDPDYYSHDALYERFRARLVTDYGVDFTDDANALGRAMLDFMVFVLENTSQMMYNTVEQLFPTRVSKREFLNYLLDKEGQFIVEQKPTILLVELTSNQLRVYPKYSIKLQSGEVAFWNTEEIECLAGVEVVAGLATVNTSTSACLS